MKMFFIGPRDRRLAGEDVDDRRRELVAEQRQQAMTNPVAREARIGVGRVDAIWQRSRLEPLPHVDGVIWLDEPDRLGILARVLRNEIAQRQRWLQATWSPK